MNTSLDGKTTVWRLEFDLVLRFLFNIFPGFDFVLSLSPSLRWIYLSEQNIKLFLLEKLPAEFVTEGEGNLLLQILTNTQIS